MTNQMLNAALFYSTHLHWQVFPLSPRSKDPMPKDLLSVGGEGGFKVASCDPALVAQWWKKFSDANLGVATGARSGIVVLDIDAGHGGEESLIQLQVNYGKLPDTLTAKTGGGGRHLIYAHPGAEIRNSAGKLGKGLDIRGDGGYIVAAPSIHPNGTPYTWITRPSQIAPAVMPAWLVGLLSERPADASAPMQAAPIDEQITSGARNQTLTSLAGSMRRRGMGNEAIYAALWTENIAKCKPPLSENEVQKIVQSVSRYSPAAPIRSYGTPQTGQREMLQPHEPMNAIEGVTALLDLLDNLEGRSIPAFIKPVDEALGGFERQTLSILAARPSMGKSSLAWQVARNIAAHRLKSYFFSLEMSTASLWAKASCGAAALRWRDVRAGKADEKQLARLISEAEALALRYGEYILVDDGLNNTDTIWQNVEKYRPDFVVIDHLDLLADDTGDNQNLRLGQMTKTLKALAKAMNCHVMCLHQLNRGVEQRTGDKRPLLSDLRESGHIEQDADLVLMLYRDDYYNPPVIQSKTSLTEIWVRKFRDDTANQKIDTIYNLSEQWFYGKNDTILP